MVSAGGMVPSTPEISATQGNLPFPHLLSAHLKYVSLHAWSAHDTPLPILGLNLVPTLLFPWVSQQGSLQRDPGADLHCSITWSSQSPTQRQKSNRCCDKIKVLHNIAEELCVADSCCPFFYLPSFFEEFAWPVGKSMESIISTYTQVASSWCF